MDMNDRSPSIIEDFLAASFWAHAATYDPVHKEMLIFGGSVEDDVFDKLWRLTTTEERFPSQMVRWDSEMPAGATPTQMTVLHIGAADASPLIGVDVDLWDQVGGEWTALGFIPASSESSLPAKTLQKTVSADLSNYFDDGVVRIRARAVSSAGKESQVKMFADCVELQVDYQLP